MSEKDFIGGAVNDLNMRKRADDLSMRRQIREIQVKNNITPVEYTKKIL